MLLQLPFFRPAAAMDFKAASVHFSTIDGLVKDLEEGRIKDLSQNIENLVFHWKEYKKANDVILHKLERVRRDEERAAEYTKQQALMCAMRHCIVAQAETIGVNSYKCKTVLNTALALPVKVTCKALKSCYERVQEAVEPATHDQMAASVKRRWGQHERMSKRPRASNTWAESAYPLVLPGTYFFAPPVPPAPPAGVPNAAPAAPAAASSSGAPAAGA